MARLLLSNVAMAVRAVSEHRRAGRSERVEGAMRTYKRASVLAGFVSASASVGDVALPKALRAEERALSAALEAALADQPAETAPAASCEGEQMWPSLLARLQCDRDLLLSIKQGTTLSSGVGGTLVD